MPRRLRVATLTARSLLLGAAVMVCTTTTATARFSGGSLEVRTAALDGKTCAQTDLTSVCPEPFEIAASLRLDLDPKKLHALQQEPAQANTVLRCNALVTKSQESDMSATGSTRVYPHTRVPTISLDDKANQQPHTYVRSCE